MALLGMRHLALRVRDPQASKRFYSDCFGMKVVWEPDPDNVYLSSGPDNLALHRAEVAGPGALDHLGFIVDEKEEVDRLAERFRQRGIALTDQPRDHRDGSRSFYCLDPDGLRIQVLYEPTLSQQSIT
ncbi:MAG: glyoxalase [Acidobacteria bacterium]|nr:MAG: glyoxalase [Acidobacteriota bacterium]PYQ22457.1 MAG: glyoxalase [Acidobacteriota bacterium]